MRYKTLFLEFLSNRSVPRFLEEHLDSVFFSSWYKCTQNKYRASRTELFLERDNIGHSLQHRLTCILRSSKQPVFNCSLNFLSVCWGWRPCYCVKSLPERLFSLITSELANLNQILWRLWNSYKFSEKFWLSRKKREQMVLPVMERLQLELSRSLLRFGHPAWLAGRNIEVWCTCAALI